MAEHLILERNHICLIMATAVNTKRLVGENSAIIVTVCTSFDCIRYEIRITNINVIQR